MAGQEKQFPCAYCGELATKSGSSCGMHYNCGDHAIQEWPGLNAIEELVKELFQFRDAYGVAYQWMGERTLEAVYKDLEKAMGAK